MVWDKLLINGARLLLTYPWESHMRTRASPRAEAAAPAGVEEEAPPPSSEKKSSERDLPPQPSVATASTEETIAWQRRQIAKEFYSLQRNLAAGGMIAGKPCDCLSGKHVLGLEALAEETMAMHQDPVYQEMIDWTKELDAKGTPEAIASGNYTEDYQRMAQEARAFRKRLLGTEAPGAMLTEQERGEILNRAKNIAREKADALVENALEVQSGPN